MKHYTWKHDPYRAGVHYGLQLQQQGMHVLDMLKMTVREEKREFARACRAHYATWYPEILEEVRGISDALAFEPERLEELLFCMYAFPIDVRCSCLAFRGVDGHMYFGRNSDFLTAMEDVYESNYVAYDDHIPFIGNTTACLQMEDGVNAHALAAGLTFICPKQRRPGLHAGFLIRYILEHCTSVNEALQVLEDLPIASAQTITLVDAKEAAVVECNCERMHVVRSQSHVWATNRFHHPDMLSYNVDGIDDMGSEIRWQTLAHAMETPSRFSRTYMQEILSGKHGFLCQYDRRLGGDTVWSSLYDLTDGRLWRCEGNPSREKYQEDTRLSFMDQPCI